MPPSHLLTLAFVALFALVPTNSLGQVSPTQSTPDEARQQHLGLYWIGEWPQSVTVSDVMNDEGGFVAVGLTTDHFSCVVLDTARYDNIYNLYDPSQVAWNPYNTSATVVSIVNYVSSSATDQEGAYAVAIGEDGRRLEFTTQDHSWVLLFASGPEAKTVYVEMWRTEDDDAVLFTCDGPRIEEFNDAFDEFEAIRGGISFPDNTYDPAGEPFAGPTPRLDATPPAD